MIYRDNDFDYFKRNYPFYIEIFERYDRLLIDKFNAQLSVRIRDSYNSDRIVFDSVGFSTELLSGRNQLIQELLKELEDKINNTCNRCGKSPANHRFEYRRHLEENQLVLCDKCYLKIDNVKIRYINSFDEFDYAKFGTYFFEGESLFIITDKDEYKQHNIKSQFIDTAYKHYTTCSKYIIKGIYSGQDTGYRDDNDERIYTGDIVMTEGFINKERDPYAFDDKLRNVKTNNNVFIYKVCGVVATNPNDNSELNKNVYQVVLDNHGAFLIHSTKVEIIGNIFHNLKRSEKINIWHKACSLAQSGHSKNGFWSLHSMETVKDDLKMIKTPSFVD